MKRNSSGAPVIMVHRWNRPPLSCQSCREKKRRCDRNQPCSNCTLRNIKCEYTWHSEPSEAEKEGEIPEVALATTGSSQVPTNASNVLTTPRQDPASLNAEEALCRIRQLEKAVFERSNQALQSTSTTCSQPEHGARDKDGSLSLNFAPFGLHLVSISPDEPSIDIAYVAKHLPPIKQARELFSHFALTVQLTFGVYHLPSTRALMEQTYQSMFEGDEPSMTNLLLLFTIFTSAAAAWTPQLLEKLHSTQAEAKAAFTAYSRLAMSILDSHRPVAPSTTALAAMGNLIHLLTNTNGFQVKVHVLRFRCLLMARAMKIQCLDTAKAREERRLKGCNMIEIEVQRRIWWNLVASDWLTASSGGPQEGAYIFQPKDMNVNYPSNVDDEFITPEKVEHDFPLSTPTSMSAFIYRVKLADICRQIVDAMPSILLESQELEYDVVLGLDEKLQTFLKELPDFFQLDPVSIQRSQEVCNERPNITWQRISVHFGLHMRLCRLHRPYHLEGSTNPKYSYSHRVCIRSAKTILELRRLMDDEFTQIGFNPGKSWTVIEHVFLAALILATDVSFNPNAPDAKDRKAMVLAAYQTLEASEEESGALMEGIQRNMQTLMSTLRNRRPHIAASHSKESTGIGNELNLASSETTSNAQSARGLSNSFTVDGDEIALNIQPSQHENASSAYDGIQSSSLINEAVTEQGSWDQLWSEFVAVAPELDAPQWSSLLDDMDFIV